MEVLGCWKVEGRWVADTRKDCATIEGNKKNTKGNRRMFVDVTADARNQFSSACIDVYILSVRRPRIWPFAAQSGLVDPYLGWLLRREWQRGQAGGSESTPKLHKVILPGFQGFHQRRSGSWLSCKHYSQAEIRVVPDQARRHHHEGSMKEARSSRSFYFRSASKPFLE